METERQQPSLFGLNIPLDEARLVVLPIPWEGTVSFRTGTSKAPEHIIAISHQIDHYDPNIANAWELGVAALPIPPFVEELNRRALEYRTQLHTPQAREFLNSASFELLRWIEQTADHWLRQGKLVALLGGEHSITAGLIAALQKHHSHFSVLQLDAHTDLRKSYEGLHYSHATAMYHVLRYEAVDRLVAVGVRDYSQEEAVLIDRSAERIRIFHSWDLHTALFRGTPWETLCDRIVSLLSPKVYITFDIDVLTPSYCPHTGTPVPGGFHYMQLLYLLHKIRQAGKRIIGFDLVEVGYNPQNNLDVIIAAYLLYQLANITIVSNNPNANGEIAP